MEHPAIQQSVTPHIQRVLKRFQNASVRSLSGPNGLPIVNDSKMSVEEYRKVVANVKKCTPAEKGLEYDPFLAPPFPIQQMPVFSSVDCSRSDKGDTILEGETISCFLVGGEKRLCLPQILNTVLRDFTLQQINAVCDDLHIFCSRCSPEQLDTLKITAILPISAPSCGLITKTDAERLTNALLHRNAEKYLEPPSPNSFRVYHECFGKCKGLFSPELYISPDSKCVQCMDCHCLLSPPKFVCHSHKALENRTCHWGFDSCNWRSYLLLTKDQDCREELHLMKARFDPGNKYKRKQSPDRDGCEGKRIKSDGPVSPLGGLPMSDHPAALRGMSAFQPWPITVLGSTKDGKLLPPSPAIMREGLTGILPSYLHTGPPVLLHPERVVPYSESERYERHYTPNVALAPPPPETLKVENGNMSPKEEMSETPMTQVSSSPSVRGRKDYREYDLTTDTDDSSIGQSSPSDADDAHLETLRPGTSLEAEMNLIRQVLDGKIANTREAKDSFLHEFSNLRTRQEEHLNTLTVAKSTLKQELAVCKGRAREAVEKKKGLQKELERTRIESECRLHDLLEKIDLIKSQADPEVCEKYMLQNHELKSRLKHFESGYHEAERENSIMREELKRNGINVAELLQNKSKYVGCNGTTLDTGSRIISPEKDGMAKKSDYVMFRHPKFLGSKERGHQID